MLSNISTTGLYFGEAVPAMAKQNTVSRKYQLYVSAVAAAAIHSCVTFKQGLL
jgi:hypothetical protein